MTERSSGRLPLSAIAAAFAGIIGSVYCLNIRSIFEFMHWYSFSGVNNLSYESFNTLLTFFGIVLFVYYAMYLVMAVQIVMNIDNHVTAVLGVMAGAKLTAVGMMFAAGSSMLFQFGFEAFLEIAAIVTLMLMRKRIRKDPGVYQSRFSVGIIASLAEAIPLIRNIQYLMLDEVNAGIRISLIILPIVTAAALFLCTLRALKPYEPVEDEMSEAVQ